MNKPAYNILILGISYFDGMACSTRVRNLFEPLIEKGLIQTSNLIYQKDLQEQIGDDGERNNIIYRVIDFKFPNILSVIRFFRKGFSFIKQHKLKDGKNILYVFDYPNLKNIFFLLYARLKGYKIVMDIVEDNEFEIHVGLLHRLRILSSKVLVKFSKNIASTALGITEHLCKKLKVITNLKIPVHLIPITVNLKYFSANGYRFNPEDIKIFYGGSFGKKDGLDFLIPAFDAAAQKSKNIKLILTGIGHKDDMDAAFAHINNAVNKDRILYKGFLTNDEYYKMLNECDIFCMTRINSQYANAGFPFKLGEFLASRKAVIATSVGDVPLYLKNEVNAMLIKPDSKEEIENAITTLVSHPEKITAIGLEGRKVAEEFFDTEKVSAKMFGIFEDMYKN